MVYDLDMLKAFYASLKEDRAGKSSVAASVDVGRKDSVHASV